MVEKTCQECGAKFDAKYGRNKYCTKECSAKHFIKQLGELQHEKYNSGIVYSLSMEDWKWRQKKVKEVD